MSEKAKMVNALVKECRFSEEAGGKDGIYSMRSALFHSGAYDKVLNKLP